MCSHQHLVSRTQHDPPQRKAGLSFHFISLFVLRDCAILFMCNPRAVYGVRDGECAGRAGAEHRPTCCHSTDSLGGEGNGEVLPLLKPVEAWGASGRAGCCEQAVGGPFLDRGLRKGSQRK